jgi:hypothetical protein
LRRKGRPGSAWKANEASVVREDTTGIAVPQCAIEPFAFSTLDLFCGAGGITEGFRWAGFSCLYGNDIEHWAVWFVFFRGVIDSSIRDIHTSKASAIRAALAEREVGLAYDLWQQSYKPELDTYNWDSHELDVEVAPMAAPLHA